MYNCLYNNSYNYLQVNLQHRTLCFKYTLLFKSLLLIILPYTFPIILIVKQKYTYYIINYKISIVFLTHLPELKLVLYKLCKLLIHATHTLNEQAKNYVCPLAKITNLTMWNFTTTNIILYPV
jgi:hypothetical protein